MQTYEIIVSGRAVHANSADTTLVRTSIGIDKVHVLFDNEEWTNFPVRVTFANGDTIISTSLTLTEIDAPEWAAEAECAIPWEVIQDLGGIRITFQGTDASGNHIITEASGEPLSVVEAGDVGSGTVPSPAPSVDEWNQAYANAMAAANSASGAAESATEAAERANTAAADAEQVLEDGIPLMDADTRGGAKLGDGLEVDESEALNAKVGGDITIDGDGAISYELPIMSATQHGGATLGSGLRVDDGALSLGPLVESGSGASVETHGSAIFGVEGEGWSEQVRTTGKNLSPFFSQGLADTDYWYTTSNYSSYFQLLGDGWAKVNASSVNINVSPKQSWQNLLASTTYTIVAEVRNYSVASGTPSICLYKASNSVWAGEHATVPITGNGVFRISKATLADLSSATHVRTFINTDNCTNVTFDIRLSLYEGEYSGAFEPYSGGVPGPNPSYPFPIEVCRGRNLFNASNVTHGYFYSTNSSIQSSSNLIVFAPVVPGTTYTLSRKLGQTESDSRLVIGFTSETPSVGTSLLSASDLAQTLTTYTFTAPSGAKYVVFYVDTLSHNLESDIVASIQIEEGSTPTPYVPYGHVGLEVRDANDAVLSCTPIPLPSKGWAGAVGDYADALAIDSAGRVEWTDATAIIASYNGETVGSTYMSTTGGLDTGATVLYPLATPTTEESYIDLPAIPDGAIISCPELAEVGVRCFVAGASEMVEHVSNVYRRIEAALSEIATS